MFIQKKIKSVLLLFFVISIIFIFLPESVNSSEFSHKPFSDSNFVEIEDIVFHYRLKQPDNSQIKGKILLVHGMGGSTFCWRENMPVLYESGYLVVAVDLPAFGYSDRQRGLDHSASSRARWLNLLLEYIEQNYQTPVGGWTLIGHSMGGSVITAMVIDYPDQINQLIYIAGAVYNSPPSLVADLIEKFPFENIFEFLIENLLINELVVRRALQSAYGQTLTAEEIDAYLQPLKLEGTAGTWIDLIKSSSPLDVSGISEIEQTALLIWGAEDSWVKPEDGQRLKEDLQKAKLEIIAGSYHMPMITDAKIVNEMIIDFLGAR